MKLVAEYWTGGVITLCRTHIVCLEYSDKQSFLRDIEQAVVDARAQCDIAQLRQDEYYKTKPQNGTLEYDEWLENYPIVDFSFKFAGQSFELGGFGSINTPIRLPDVYELDEWFYTKMHGEQEEQ